MRDSELSAKQEKALRALLTEPTIRDAAKAAQISEAQCYRWLNDDDFRAAYRAARRDLMQQATARLQQAASDAVTTLRAVLVDPAAPPSAKISAAKTILDAALRATELDDLDARLTALEAQEAANEP